MKLKILILILGIFLISNNSIAQVTLLLSDTSKVIMPKNTYKAIRLALYKKDTLIDNQDKIIVYKDSIIKLTELKCTSFKDEIRQKNITIDTLSTEYNKLHKQNIKEKNSYFTNFKLWLGITSGLIFGMLIAK